MHQIVMQKGILSFSCNVIFVNPFVADSILCLVDSCASAIQSNFVFASDALAFPVFVSAVFRLHAFEIALLHGIAAAFGVSNFRLAFLMMSL